MGHINVKKTSVILSIFIHKEYLVIDRDVVNCRPTIVPTAEVAEQRVKTEAMQHRVCEGLLFCSLFHHPDASFIPSQGI